MTRRRRPARRRRAPRRSPFEYFLAALGLALIILVVALVLTSPSCELAFTRADAVSSVP